MLAPWTWSTCQLTNVGKAGLMADGKGDSVADQEQAVSQCRHYWLVESPNGPTSQGVCKLCGERAEFRNSMPGSGWDRGVAQAKRARQARGG